MSCIRIKTYPMIPLSKSTSKRLTLFSRVYNLKFTYSLWVFLTFCIWMFASFRPWRGGSCSLDWPPDGPGHCHRSGHNKGSVSWDFRPQVLSQLLLFSSELGIAIAHFVSELGIAIVHFCVRAGHHNRSLLHQTWLSQLVIVLSQWGITISHCHCCIRAGHHNWSLLHQTWASQLVIVLSE